MLIVGRTDEGGPGLLMPIVAAAMVAVVEPGFKSKGHASFVVPPNTPGLSMGQKCKKHGIRASHTAEVVLDDVWVPGSCLLGGKDKLDERLARVREGKSGNAQAAMQTFEATRPSVGAQALGVARAAYEFSLEYAKEREAFGRKMSCSSVLPTGVRSGGSLLPTSGQGGASVVAGTGRARSVGAVS